MATIPKGNSEDLEKIRSILFGEQSDQIEDRIRALESSVSALEKSLTAHVDTFNTETNSIRDSLGKEATTRAQALQQVQSEIVSSSKISHDKLTNVLLNQANETQAQRAAYIESLHAAVEAMRQNQNNLLSQIASLMTAQQKINDEQFAAVQSALNRAKQDDEKSVHLMATEITKLNANGKEPAAKADA